MDNQDPFEQFRLNKSYTYNRRGSPECEYYTPKQWYVIMSSHSQFRGDPLLPPSDAVVADSLNFPLFFVTLNPMTFHLYIYIYQHATHTDRGAVLAAVVLF